MPLIRSVNGAVNNYSLHGVAHMTSKKIVTVSATEFGKFGKAFDKLRAGRVADALLECGDAHAHVVGMRAKVAVEFKGFPARMLEGAALTMVTDAIRNVYDARSDLTDGSKRALKSRDIRVATAMPVILRMEAASFDKVSRTYDSLAKFATQLKKSEGDVDAAMAGTKEKKADFVKSAATHVRSLLGLTKGKHKHNSPEAKAILVAYADYCGLPVGKLADEHRNVNRATKSIATL